MKKIMIIFPKDSEAVFNKESGRTFGGATVQMYLLAKEMRRNKDSEVYSMICDYDIINFNDTDKFNLIKSFKETDSFPVKIFKTHRRISKIKPDVIIQLGLTNESCLMALYCYLKKIKFVFMFAHDVEVKRKFQSSGKRCYLFSLLMRFSPLMIAQNKFQLETLQRNYSSYKNKITLLYNGFPFKKQPVKKEKSILWVARSDSWKRPELFIKLASLNPEIKFVMICSNSGDDQFYNELLELSGKTKNLEFIRFVSFDKIDIYFEKGYIYVNTSDHEGFPQVFIQAVMNGMPILSLNVNPDDFITSNNCGMVFNGNFDLMNQQMQKLVKNSKLYKSYSDNSYSYFLEKHNTEHNTAQLLNMINELF